VYQRRDGRWVGAAYVLTADGGYRRKPCYGSTEDEARDKMIEAQKRSDAGLPDESNVRLAEYLRQWLAEVVKPQVRGRTYETYQRVVERHLVPALGRKRLHKLTPTDVRRFMTGKSADRLAPQTVTYMRSVLRSALAEAMRDGLVQRNVAALTKPPRVPRNEITPLTEAEARRLLHTSRTDRLGAFWLIAVSLGLRRSEILGLRWSRIDLDGRTLRTTHGVQRVAGKLVLDELKSRTSHRTLPLPRVVVDALREHRTRQASERLAAGPAWQDLDLVFCTQLGGPLDPRNINREFRSLLIRARVGVEWEGEPDDPAGRWITRVRLHDLRHSCASFLLAQGVSARVVMEILGHSGIAITMNTYAHVLPNLAGLSTRRYGPFAGR